MWGSGLGCRTDGRPFEKLALRFLKNTNQYDSLLWASEYNGHFPFDIIAKRDEQLTFFEVITATHHGDKKKPGRLWLANVLNGKLVAFFISPDGKRYVIKPVAKEHPSIHLTLEDVRSAKEFEA